jgi:tRNA (guanine-N7-)-methyltransferase
VVKDLENDNLYITRKRKLWKFAHFETYQNCFDFGHFIPRSDRPYDGDSLQDAADTLQQVFKKQQPLVLELAAGNAQFSLALATLHPEQNFIAVDIKADRLYTSAKQALVEGIDNIIFVRLHISMIDRLLPNHSVDTVWLTFPDPRPKKGDRSQRLTHPHFLERYQTVLKSEGELYFKTDNKRLFDWSLEQFDQCGWHQSQITRNLQRSNVADEYKIMTQYEQKYHKNGDPIYFVRLSAHKK